MAYEIDYDILLDTKNTKEAQQVYQKRTKVFEETLQEYNQILDRIITNAVKEGELNKALRCFQKATKKLEGELQVISKQAKTCVSDFRQDMKGADNYTF